MMTQPDRKYFAYGSNMDPRQMEFRCPGAIPDGVGILEGFRFIINNRGVASIVPEKGSRVIGVLWSITDEHEKTLDGYEGVASGFYFRENVIIEISRGWYFEALVYIASESEEGPPREGYLEKILFGADHFKLPAEYLKKLESWAG